MKIAGSLTILCIALIFIGAGCGGSFWRPDNPAALVPAAKPVNMSETKKVAVFPFAAYTRAKPLESSPELGINLRAQKEVIDCLLSRRIEVVPQEDVTDMLLADKAIFVLRNSPEPSTIEWELKTRWHSPPMQKNMANLISDDSLLGSGWGKAGGQDDPEGVTADISPKLLEKIGTALGADKVIRGRIIDHGILKDRNWDAPEAILDVVWGGLVGGTGGFAYRKGYEQGLPPASYASPDVFGDLIKLDAAVGAVVPVGKLSDVQIRLYLQDVKTAKVLWASRADVRFDPSGALGPDRRPTNALDTAVKDAVAAMMADLFKSNAAS